MAVAGIRHEITNGDDVIDSRDVIERIEELEDLATDESISEDELDELRELHTLANEAEPYAADWQYGEALIRVSHFVEWAQDFARDIGAYDTGDVEWPQSYIDWDAAADALRIDYTEVDFAGVAYLIR